MNGDADFNCQLGKKRLHINFPTFLHLISGTHKLDNGRPATSYRLLQSSSKGLSLTLFQIRSAFITLKSFAIFVYYLVSPPAACAPMTGLPDGIFFNQNYRFG
jgi:hypothetical protein